MKDYYVRKVHDRLYEIVHNPESDDTEVVATWSHPELAQEDAERWNENLPGG